MRTLKAPKLRVTLILLVVALTMQIWLVNLDPTDIASLLNIFYLFASVPLTITGLMIAIKNLKKHHLKAAILASLCFIVLLLFLAAKASYDSRKYITGDGGPAGPEFTCITWDESDDIGYNDFLGTRQCVYYYTPELNKFWFDQSRFADSEYGVSSYVSLGLHISVLMAIYCLALQKRPRNSIK